MLFPEYGQDYLDESLVAGSSSQPETCLIKKLEIRRANLKLKHGEYDTYSCGVIMKKLLCLATVIFGVGYGSVSLGTTTDCPLTKPVCMKNDGKTTPDISNWKQDCPSCQFSISIAPGLGSSNKGDVSGGTNQCDPSDSTSVWANVSCTSGSARCDSLQSKYDDQYTRTAKDTKELKSSTRNKLKEDKEATDEAKDLLNRDKEDYDKAMAAEDVTYKTNLGNFKTDAEKTKAAYEAERIKLQSALDQLNTDLPTLEQKVKTQTWAYIKALALTEASQVQLACNKLLNTAATKQSGGASFGISDPAFQDCLTSEKNKASEQASQVLEVVTAAQQAVVALGKQINSTQEQLDEAKRSAGAATTALVDQQNTEKFRHDRALLFINSQFTNNVAKHQAKLVTAQQTQQQDTIDAVTDPTAAAAQTAARNTSSFLIQDGCCPDSNKSEACNLATVSSGGPLALAQQAVQMALQLNPNTNLNPGIINFLTGTGFNQVPNALSGSGSK